MRALVLAAVLLAGCATRAPVSSAPPTCAAELWVTTGRGLTITGECVDGRPLRVIGCDRPTRKVGCEFHVPADCVVRRLTVETRGEILRRDSQDRPLAQSWCIWLET